jgi:hypothetical protein
MKENMRTTYRISEAARELGISIEWLRKGEVLVHTAYRGLLL